MHWIFSKNVLYYDFCEISENKIQNNPDDLVDIECLKGTYSKKLVDKGIISSYLVYHIEVSDDFVGFFEFDASDHYSSPTHNIYFKGLFLAHYEYRTPSGYTEDEGYVLADNEEEALRIAGRLSTYKFSHDEKQLLEKLKKMIIGLQPVVTYENWEERDGGNNEDKEWILYNRQGKEVGKLYYSWSGVSWYSVTDIELEINNSKFKAEQIYDKGEVDTTGYFDILYVIKNIIDENINEIIKDIEV